MQFLSPGDTMLTTEQARVVVAPFYESLNQPASKNVRALIEGAVAPDWRSFAGEKLSKGRDEFIQQVIGFGKLIPDLAWEIKELFVDGERIVVRSEARGTPAGDFMGTAHSGKSFTIMTLDVHTVAAGKLVRAHHVEDWASAIRQLQATPAGLKTQYIEAVRFRLKANVEDAQLLAAEKAVRGVIHGQRGYQGRDLFNDGAGNWFIIIRWDTKVAADAWSQVFKGLPEGSAFGGLMDFASARQEHYTGTQQ
jgi:predicted ester cyclase